MIEYKNDEAFNFDTVGQENLTKENIIAELTRRIEWYDDELSSIIDDGITSGLMTGEQLAYKIMRNQIINNCFLK